VDRGALDYSIVSYAERVLDEARYQLDLHGRAYGIRWYVRSEQADQYRLTRYGRVLDVPDERHLSGWYLDPAWIAVRADRSLRDIGLTVAHEVYHAWQERHGKPLNEDAAERFARRLLAHIEGEAA
jgi:hypothetical protein